MSLVDDWKSKSDELKKKDLKQIVGFAGDGKLRDGNNTSREFREFLAVLPSAELERRAREALAPDLAVDGREGRGRALQDIVNVVGQRLGFSPVEFGLYQGTTNKPGWDGLWRLERKAIVVEVKTTNIFRIRLNVIAGYRAQVIEKYNYSENNLTMLIVVGRGEDTEDLEDQIRGSLYSRNMRLISVDSLLQLMFLKEKGSPQVMDKIHNFLFPTEFIRLDKIVEMAFTATSYVNRGDKKYPLEINSASSDADKTSLPKQMPSRSNYEWVISQVEKHLGISLSRVPPQNRQLYKSPDDVRVKPYINVWVQKDTRMEEYAFLWEVAIVSEHWDFLDARESYAAIQLRSKGRIAELEEGKILLIPGHRLLDWKPTLDKLKKDEKIDKQHFSIGEDKQGRLVFRRKTKDKKKKYGEVILDEYLLPTK